MNLHQYAETHQVTNQPPSLDGVNLYRIDRVLQQWSQHFGAGWAQARIDEYGALAGGPLMVAGFLANEKNRKYCRCNFGNSAKRLSAITRLLERWKIKTKSSFCHKSADGIGK